MDYSFWHHNLLKIFICRNCNAIITLEDFITADDDIFLNYRCNCIDNEQNISLFHILPKIYNLTHARFQKNNNLIFFIKNNNWNKIKLTSSLTLSRNNCNCNNDITDYCMNCKLFICNNCSIKHYYHNWFKYEKDIYINNNDLHKLEKYAYQSYIKFKQCNTTAKSKLMKILNKDDLNIIDEYIKYNDKINDSLYLLFRIVLNTFKISRNLTSYLNLSYFGYFNNPFNFPKYYKGMYRKYNKLNLLQSFINHCKSIFLIPIHTNNIHFSFVKELKYIRSLNYKFLGSMILKPYRIFYVDLITKKQFLRGEILNTNKLSQEYERSNPYMIKVPPRIEKIILLDDQTLLFLYKYQSIIIYYNFNIKKLTLDWNYYTTLLPLTSIIQIKGTWIGFTNDRIYICIDDEKPKYLNIEANYCVEIEYPKILLISKDIRINTIDNILKYKKETSTKFFNFVSPGYKHYINFTFGFRFSNGLVFIYGKFVIHILNIEDENDIKSIACFENDAFYNLNYCYENLSTKIIYCQTGTHIILFNSKTLQIQSIYNTFHFKFSPLVNTKRDLMTTLFERINFDTKKISKLFLTSEYKDIYQISEHILLVMTPKHLYWYEIN